MFSKRAVNLPALASLLAVGLLFPALQAVGAPDSQEVSDLLSQAKSEAVQIKTDSSDMETFTRQTVTWESHADRIRGITEDINRIGETVAKLNSASPTASPWQKTAIARINPMLKELADNTTTIIDHLNNEKGKFINNQEHKDLLKTNADLASDMAAVITDFVNYGETRSKYLELRQKLEVEERAPRH